MLRIIQNRSPASAASYYSHAEYYGEGQEKAGIWGGRTAHMLGLEGRIQESDFQALEMEQEARTRVRIGGRQEDRTTGNLIWGQFLHTTTCPEDKGEVDPHLHIHCFVFNVTHDAKEDRFKAAQFRELKRDASFFEARMHARLAKALRDELGYSIERDGRDTVQPLNLHWTPEVTWLSEEQTNAIRQLTQSHDRMQLILGGAGTGKTTLMSQAVAAIEARGHKVFTFAPSADASKSGDIRLTNGWVIDRDIGHISQGFVTTSHASQGRTVDHTFIAVSAESFAAAGREQMYVSASRGRHSAHIYTNNKAELRDVILESAAKITATELFQPSKQHDLHKKQQQAAVVPLPEKHKLKELSYGH